MLEWHNAAIKLNTIWVWWQSALYYTSCVDVTRCFAYAHRPRKGARFRLIHKKIRINNRSYVRRDNSRIQQNSRQSQSVSIVSIAQSSMLAKSFALVHVRKYKRAANSGIHRRKTLKEKRGENTALSESIYSGKRPTHKKMKNQRQKRAGMSTGKNQHICASGHNFTILK